MNELDRLHQEAMELVDRAILCRRQGKLEAAIGLPLEKCDRLTV